MTSLLAGRTYDLLPPNFKGDPEIRAFCHAVDRLNEKVFEKAQKTQVWSRLREMPEDVVDYLAAELRTPFYDKVSDLDVKRDMVANTFEWYAHLGTRETLAEIIAAVYGDADVAEWFECGGEPYTFRVKLYQILNGWREVEDFIKLLVWAKNARSWLDNLTMAGSWEKRLWHFEYAAGQESALLKPDYLKSSAIHPYRRWRLEFSAGRMGITLKPECLKNYAMPQCRSLLSAVREQYVF